MQLKEVPFEELRDTIHGMLARGEISLPSGCTNNFYDNFRKLYLEKIEGMIERGESLQSIPYEDFVNYYSRNSKGISPSRQLYEQLSWEGKSRQHFETLGRDVYEKYRNGETITADERRWMGLWFASPDNDSPLSYADQCTTAEREHQFKRLHDDLAKFIRDSGISLDDNETFEIVVSANYKISIVGIEDEDRRRQIQDVIQSYTDKGCLWYAPGVPADGLLRHTTAIERYVKRETGVEISIKDLSLDSKDFIHGLPEPLSEKINNAIILPKRGTTLEERVALGLTGLGTDEEIALGQMKEFIINTLKTLQRVNYASLPPANNHFIYANGTITYIDK
jgi:hypothetical protein